MTQTANIAVRSAGQKIIPLLQVEREKNPLAVADSYSEKGIVTALMAIDTASHISPFRWFFYLAGCGASAEEGDGGISGMKETNEEDPEAASTACLEDHDCRTPKICEGGACVYPPEPSADAGASHTEAPPAEANNPPLPIEECKPGDFRSCGPCDIGFQWCNANHLWESVCEYVQGQLEQSCYTGPAGTSGKGICQQGKQRCDNGVTWSPCEGETTPAAEICDGQDNNCDGLTDEGSNGAVQTREFYPDFLHGLGVGLCRSGLEYCENGTWKISRAPVLPQPEACDGQDNDCDGETDEGYNCGKIGDPCRVFPDCDSGRCIQPGIFPGGYCTDSIDKRSYERTRECPPATGFRRAVCVEHSEFALNIPDFICAVLCVSDTDCRQDEGYLCKPIIDSALKVCLPQHNEVVTAVFPNGEIPACSH